MEKRILIVEDQPDLRRLIRMTLELTGYALYEAENGNEGLAQALRVLPDIVLLDVMMPGSMDGLQVCERIRREPTLRNTRVVFVSARGQRADMDAGFAAGAVAYLIKPFSPLELIDLIDGLIAVGAH